MGSINVYPKNRHIEGIGVICWYCPFKVETKCEDDGHDFNSTYDCAMDECIVPGFDNVTRYRFYYDQKDRYIIDAKSLWARLPEEAPPDPEGKYFTSRSEIIKDIQKRMKEHRPR